MALNVGQMMSELRRMTVTELQRKYAEAFGEHTRSHHKAYLIRRIAWRIQANSDGGLSERARQRAGKDRINTPDPPVPGITPLEQVVHNVFDHSYNPPVMGIETIRKSE